MINIIIIIISDMAVKTLIHAFITSKFDFCNSLFYGIPKYLLNRLQKIQNSAARIVTSTKRSDHTTPILNQLHWLLIESRIKCDVIWENPSHGANFHCSLFSCYVRG